MKKGAGPLRAQYWNDITAIAARQRGLVTFQQVRATGCPIRTLRRTTNGGLLVPVRREVFELPGLPPDPKRPLLAACLAGGPGVVASHLSAAWLWGYDRIAPGALEVTGLVTWDRAFEDVRVHRSW